MWVALWRGHDKVACLSSASQLLTKINRRHSNEKNNQLFRRSLLTDYSPNTDVDSISERWRCHCYPRLRSREVDTIQLEHLILDVGHIYSHTPKTSDNIVWGPSGNLGVFNFNNFESVLNAKLVISRTSAYLFRVRQGYVAISKGAFLSLYLSFVCPILECAIHAVSLCLRQDIDQTEHL